MREQARRLLEGGAREGSGTMLDGGVRQRNEDARRRDQGGVHGILLCSRQQRGARPRFRRSRSPRLRLPSRFRLRGGPPELSSRQFEIGKKKKKEGTSFLKLLYVRVSRKFLSFLFKFNKIGLF